MLADREDPAVIQSWLTGPNPELGNRVPVRLVREMDFEIMAPELMGAARRFLAGDRSQICGIVFDSGPTGGK